MAATLLLLLLVPAAASAQPSTAASTEHGGGFGAAFTMSNAISGNSVIAYTLGPSGALTWTGNFSTGGTGTGASLADSGSLALSSDHQFLLVVNAGSDSISVFRVAHPTFHGPVLTLVGTAGSGGVEPVSVTVSGSWVYVLNAGNASTPGNIAGFALWPSGALTSLAGSTQPLSSGTPTGPAEIAFNPQATILIVTEENTNLIDAYPLNSHGIAQTPVVTASNGTTPYGFAFDPAGALIVSDAASGALSSYTVSPSGELTVVSGTVDDFQAAPCWVAIAGSYVFTTDAHGGKISSYSVGASGSLTLLASVAATTGAADTDMAVAGTHGQLLLVYDAGAGEIQELEIGSGGTLSWSQNVTSLPATAEGLAAF